jgi:hypothetical protein
MSEAGLRHLRDDPAAAPRRELVTRAPSCASGANGGDGIDDNSVRRGDPAFSLVPGW